jgi:hypothetical protein
MIFSSLLNYKILIGLSEKLDMVEARKWKLNLFKFGSTKIKINCCSGMAELANASVIHPRDLGSNLSTDRKYF